MLYGFSIDRVALKALESLPSKIRGQCKKKIEALAAEPFPPVCKKLQNMVWGDEPIYRIRSGDYRILYIVRENPKQVIIIDIEHRKDVYR